MATHVHHEDEVADVDSAIRKLWELVRAQTVTTFVRVLCGALTVSMAFMAWGPLFGGRNRAYVNPVFDGVFQFASPQAWGFGFMVCSILLLLSAITARAALYAVAVIVSTVTLAGWASMVMYQAWRDPTATLTSGAYGLYIGTLTSLLGLAFSPRQLTVAKPIVAVLDDNVVKPLKPLQNTG